MKTIILKMTALSLIATNSLILISNNWSVNNNVFKNLHQKIASDYFQINKKLNKMIDDLEKKSVNTAEFQELTTNINTFLELIKTTSYDLLNSWSSLPVAYNPVYLNKFHEKIVTEKVQINRSFNEISDKLLKNSQEVNIYKLKNEILYESEKLKAHNITIKNYLYSAYKANASSKETSGLEEWEIIKLDQEIYQYYQPILNKSGDELTTKLNTLLTDTHKPALKGKSSNYKKLWDLYKTPGFKDLDRGKEYSILDIYSKNPSGVDKFNYTEKNQHSKGGNKQPGVSYHREHLIPQSHFKSETPMYFDAHHIFPADGWTNSRRSNYHHGIVTKPGKHTFANQAKLGKDKDGNTVFEPDEAFKGDIARSYLYFALRYYPQADLFASKSAFINSKPFIKTSILTNMLNWHENIDPVDLYDINRNNEIYKFQNNRNPFIDLHYLSQYIWNPLFKNTPLLFFSN